MNVLPEGPAVFADATAYTTGSTAYITSALRFLEVAGRVPGLQQTPQPWKLEDIVSIARWSRVFGKGGGGELLNHCGLQAMTTRSAATRPPPGAIF